MSSFLVEYQDKQEGNDGLIPKNPLALNRFQLDPFVGVY